MFSSVCLGPLLWKLIPTHCVVSKASGRSFELHRNPRKSRVSHRSDGHPLHKWMGNPEPRSGIMPVTLVPETADVASAALGAAGG